MKRGKSQEIDFYCWKNSRIVFDKYKKEIIFLALISSNITEYNMVKARNEFHSFNQSGKTNVIFKHEFSWCFLNLLFLTSFNSFTSILYYQEILFCRYFLLFHTTFFTFLYIFLIPSSLKLRLKAIHFYQCRNMSWKIVFHMHICNYSFENYLFWRFKR